MTENPATAEQEVLVKTSDSERQERVKAAAEEAVEIPLYPLAGKTCVVTGASRGIGRAIANEFARYGGTVVVNYHSSPEGAERALEEVRAHETSGMAVKADIADMAAAEAMAEAVHDEFGPIDVLVNNAGITIDKTFKRMQPEDWQRVLRVNLEGAFNVTSAFYDDILTADSGRIINISSVNGERGSYGQSNYAASKSGLIGLTRSLAQELASEGGTANVVAPGYTRTDMVEGMREDIADHIRDQIPVGRFADPQEIASTVRFLASEDAAYITGEVINVNGGLYP